MKYPNETKVFNIYSRKDSIVKLTILLLLFGKGSQHLKNANNIILNNMHHSEIEGGREIKSGIYNGLTGFKLVEKLLLD